MGTLLGIERQERHAHSMQNCVAMFPNADNVLQQTRQSSCRIVLEDTSTSASSGITTAMASARAICNSMCIRMFIAMGNDV